MPVYQYRAVTAQGREVTGEVVAANQSAARAQLAAQALLLQELSRRFRPALFRDRLTPMLFFVQGFQSLLASGLEVMQALDIAARRVRDHEFRHSLDQVLGEVRAGHPPATAFARDASHYDPLWIATLRAGQASGRMDVAVAGYEEHLKTSLELRRKVAATFLYPAILVVLIVVVLGVFMWVVIPRLEAGYMTLGGELPLPTRLLVDVTRLGPWLALTGMAGAAVAVLMTRYRMSGLARSRLYNRALQRVPIAGTIISDMHVARLASTLGLLTSAAFPIHRAVEFIADGERNPDLANRLRQASVAIADGKGLAHSFQANMLLPEPALQLMEIGEQNGELEAMLEKIGIFYKGEAEASIQRFATVVQPLLMLLIGGVIGLVVVAVYLPVFNLAQALQ